MLQKHVESCLPVTFIHDYSAHRVTLSQVILHVKAERVASVNQHA